MGNSGSVGKRIGQRDHHRGLRTVALIEASKGVLVLLAAFGFAEILLRHVDLEDAAQNLLYFLHINPNRRISHALIEIAGRMMDADLITVLAIAFAYSGLRFVEAYGLWRQRVWAEWLAIVSGAVYLPFELYHLIRRPSLGHWVVLLVNIVVVLYIAWVRWDEVTGRSRSHQIALVRNGD
ncbi:MAG TPA: DUF2127 domain-containing protein [Candidatus Eisenbacteria bacterium]|nr:DUF2127 domain-containing protein [Candidatus Eisenbacteria bacterium]